MIKKIAYLVSEYPAISHTFIFREIESLRNLGFLIKTASIQKTTSIEKMTEKEQEESKATLYIKKTQLLKVLAIHFSLLCKGPLTYCRAFTKSLILMRYTPKGCFRAIAYFAESGVLQYWLMKEKINHIHVHFGNSAATVALLTSYFNYATYSMSIHGPDIFYKIDSNLLSEKTMEATAVRAISHYCKSQLERLIPYDCWSKIHIVRCGIDTESFNVRPEPDNSISEILCIGRLVPAKGQHKLIEVVKSLKLQHKQCHLTLVGDGIDRESLESYVEQSGLSSQVSFIGAVGQDEINFYYDKADIFVLASFAEGVPVVLMEAMSKEIVSVSTNITGIPELIEHEVDGILVTPSNTDELARELSLLLENKEKRKKLGKAGREKIMKLYNIDKNSQDMADFFNSFLH
jgi:glycosyltransferase involved in cell wall biosynthesis